MSYILKDDERWLVGYEGRYFGNKKGQIFSLLKNKGDPKEKVATKVFDKNRGRDRYDVVCLTHKDKVSEVKYIHRLIAECFIPNPDNKPQINHKDLNKSNNSVDNLEWMTNSENISHSHKNGKRVYKYDKLSEEERLTIVKDYLYDYDRNTYLFDKIVLDSDYELFGIPKEVGSRRKWLKYLVLFTLEDNNTSKKIPRNNYLEVLKRINVGECMLSRVRSGDRLARPRKIYDKYKLNEKFILPHLTEIKSVCNGLDILFMI